MKAEVLKSMKKGYIIYYSIQLVFSVQPVRAIWSVKLLLEEPEVTSELSSYATLSLGTRQEPDLKVSSLVANFNEY